ncbi:filament-like plant protein 5 [Durio zibethinus]|uniref:Filament-like plant protein 5 n=1 Tax=Durio zibethinus TaxID=66656 RepID=A0A6P5YIP9_DURZI|nr:filament-like plant protein 5 [Durio zibethinus]
MDRRGWPWKKKFSNKAGTDKQAVPSDGNVSSLSSLASLGDQIHAKDGLITQHAKVAEEAVSGWEKADSEVIALKRQLENVTLLKLSVEDRASHLDDALKECTRRVMNVKEESEKKLHDVVLAKTIQWDKIKLDLEGKIAELDQGLLRAAAENQALSRSLQERSNLIAQIELEKSKTEAEIELMKENLMSREKEISSLKYELLMVSKELEIRNEENNISMRSAEVQNKQHLESVRKIAKLEAECQRLRGLVRKRFPGPAALAQMKQEIDKFGLDFSGSQSRRNVVKNPKPNLSPQMELSADNLLQSHKEIEYLTRRLLEIEEETKMLKESLATRNNELQAARDMCAKTSVRVKSLEAQMEVLNHQTSSPKSSIGHTADNPSSQYASNAPCITSLSEDGIDLEGCSAESLLPASSDISHLGMEKSSHKVNMEDNSHCLDLMDDFLEMEKLACLENDVGGANAVSRHLDDAGNCESEDNKSSNAVKGHDLFSDQELGFSPSSKQGSPSVRSSITELRQDVNLPLLKLQSRVFTVFESQTKDMDLGKVSKDIKFAMLEIKQGSLPQHSVNPFSEGVQIGYGPSNQKGLPEKSLLFLDQESVTKQNLASAISHIHQVVLSFGREAMRVQDPHTDCSGLRKKLDDFSAFVEKFVFNEKHLVEFILTLSHVFAKANQLNLGVLGFRGYDGNASNNDYIDKLAMLGNEVVQDNSSKQAFTGRCHRICHSCPDSELKLDKENVAVDLARSTEDLENTKSLLQETERSLTELKLQLASSQNLYNLAETQLKCMTESYKSLEMREQELEAQVNLLREKLSKLDDELLEEKRGHQDALARCKDLEDKLQRK